MKVSIRFVLLLCAAICARPAAAQYYTWGADAPQKWSTIRTPHVRMIYPDTAASLARRTLCYIDAVRSDIGYGFRHGPMRIPFVLHPENFRSNGLVMYLPKRVEFLSSPAIESYSMPWYKQLVAHEYRHAVQYNNLDRGVIRALSYLLGQQGSTVGLLCMPIWVMEGDAVMSETAMSSFGRGLQPSFSIGYRAMQRVGRDRRDTRYRRNIDKWFCGSYRDYVPDHYQLGYQICSYSWERYGENIWDRVAWYGSRNPYVLAITRVALGKFYRTDVAGLFRRTFDELESFWASLPVEEDSAATLTPLPADNHTTYRWPLPLDDTTAVALRSDYDRPERLVAVDRRTGRERTIARVGAVSTRPSMAAGRIWWTEYRRSKLFEQRVASQLCYLDLADGRPRTLHGRRNALYPTATPDALGWVEYTPDGRYAVVEQRTGQTARFDVPAGKELHGLAWDDLTVAWYVLVTDDGGMHLARIDCEGLHPLTRPAYVTLSHLRAADGRLYYGSIASGKDEVHCYDLTTHREYRITQSAYGSFDPAPAADEVLLTTYDRRGYRVTHQRMADSLLIPVEPASLPRNTVNPPRRRWEVLNLDSVRFSAADSLEQCGRARSRRYRKLPNLVNVHSWMPVAFDPFSAVDEHNIDLNVGATLISQNLLSSMEAYASYGWNRSEGSLLNLGVRYFGLGVQLELDASYGGRQYFYSLAQYDAQTGKYEYQNRPSPDKYYSVGLSAALPLYYQRGYHTRLLSFSAGWNYSNGMIANLGEVEIGDGGLISNITRIGYREGLHKLAFGAGFSDQVRMAHRDFAPRWGYALNASYTFNPANGHFSDLVSLYGQVYLPGFALHNSVKIAASYQTSLGGYKFPSGYAPLSYRSTRLIPRGFASSDILSNGYLAFSADYQLPVCYPEGGIGSVIYFKRIRLNVGGDYAQFRDLNGGRMACRRIWSAGGDLVFDVNLFRQPASATSTVKLSCYRPSVGGVWVSAGVGLPF